MQNLVIVESPTKARTLSRFLGNKYQIEATMGHIRDLPKAKFGIDVGHNFEPEYIVPRDKKKRVNELKKLAKDAKQLWLATDPDREGEAIAWHTAFLLDNKNYKRVVFHEITEGAIKAAFEEPREINIPLVDAQQARRVLDRLVGYKLSPLLWQKIKRGLSAGRVQSVTLRLIVEREREIEKFKAIEYWSIESELRVAGPAGSQPHPTSSTSLPLSVRGLDGAPRSPSPAKSDSFFANLVEINGQKIELNEGKGFFIHTKEEAEKHVINLKNSDYRVSSVNKKQVKRYPSAPFTTSTLQQTAGNRLGMSAKKTMMLAQNLYERGLITYMRTDSVTLSGQAIAAARNFISSSYGSSYLPSSPRIYKSKSKNAQEAHEAIRPTEIKRQSSDIGSQSGLNRDHARLYDLVWKRTVASQMSEAILDQTTVEVVAIPVGSAHKNAQGPAAPVPLPSGGPPSSLSLRVSPQEPSFASPLAADSGKYLFRASGSVLKFDGWLKVYQVSSIKYQEEENGEEGKNQILPDLNENERLDLLNLLQQQHFTQPPPRYTEASLIKRLEELGIGRPSTYAPTLSTIQDRFYVEKQERKFVPTNLGMNVTDFLLKYFPDVFDYAFTALMEDQLDDISRGERVWKKTISDFYKPFEKTVEKTGESAERIKLELEVTDKICPKCGKNLVVRTGRFGKFLACLGFPECKHTEGMELKLDAKCPEDGGEIVVRRTKKGKIFYGCSNYPKCKYVSWSKPKETKKNLTKEAKI